MIGYIPVVFFPCNGTNNGNPNQQSSQSQQSMAYPYNPNACAQCAQQQNNNHNNALLRSSNLFAGAIANAKIFHNSDMNTVTQIFPNRIRSRKAKIDQTVDVLRRIKPEQIIFP